MHAYSVFVGVFDRLIRFTIVISSYNIIRYRYIIDLFCFPFRIYRYIFY